MIKFFVQVAEVGGYLGMILGISLMDMEHIFNYILNKVVVMKHF